MNRCKNGLYVVALFVICAVGSEGAPKKKTFACMICKDSGKVVANCPVCQGSKYVWKCQPKGGGGGKGWATYEVLSNDESGMKTTEGWCGYGATYKALHRGCPNVRKRQGCPNCIPDGKQVATGKVPVACPNCDGQGHVRDLYYLVRDTEAVGAFRKEGELDTRRLRKLIERRMFTSQELAGYKAENPHCRHFLRLDELLKYFSTLETPASVVATGDTPTEKPDVEPTETPKDDSVSVATPVVVQPQLSEAVRKLIAIEEAHEREMYKRKFGEGR